MSTESTRQSGARVPKYCRQRGTNRPDRAYVRIDGKKIILGLYGTDESRARYAELIKGVGSTDSQSAKEVSHSPPMLAEIMVSYLEHAMDYYVQRDGKPGREFELIREALRVVRRHSPNCPAHKFGPRRLKEIRQAFIDDGLSRKHINKQVSRIVRMFKWAAADELIPGSVAVDLSMVGGLKQGRTTVREIAPVQPVDDSVLEATLAELSPLEADMVALQRLIGCRPGELVSMQPHQIVRTADVWLYVPDQHKTQHLGKQRQIPIGPKAQEILRKHLFGLWCFQTRLGGPYRIDSYRIACQRAAKRAGVAKWTPHQIRHNAGTEIRREYGLEAAQVVLGHSSAQITQVYAERDFDKAMQVAREIG